MTEAMPFEHKVIPRHTEFRMTPEQNDVTIQDIYAALVNDALRNEMIAADITRDTIGALSSAPHPADQASPVFRGQAGWCCETHRCFEGRHGQEAAPFRC